MSEKSDLQTANSTMQKQLSVKDAELQGAGEQMKTYQQQCIDTQKELQLLITSGKGLADFSLGGDLFEENIFPVINSAAELANR